MGIRTEDGITFERRNGFICLSALVGQQWHHRMYQDYTVDEAFSNFRQEFGL